MARRIVLPGPMYDQVRECLFSDLTREQLAFVLAGHTRSAENLILLGREVVPVPADAFAQQTGAYLEVRPGFMCSLLSRCREETLGLIEFHSHPFSDQGVSFSSIDTRADLQKLAFTRRALPGVAHAVVVAGVRALDARTLDEDGNGLVPMDEVRVLGSPMRSILPTGASPGQHGSPPEPTLQPLGMLARQIPVFGESGQTTLSRLRVAAVGLGGLGSVLALHLAHLGIRRFVLVDPDTVEETNLNRLLGCGPADVGMAKVDASKRSILYLNPEARVTALQESILSPAAISLVRDVDCIFGATDDDAARLVLNQIAVQHLIPYIDTGTGVEANEGRLERMGGQVRVVMPGVGPCLECHGGVNRHRAGLSLLSVSERELRRQHGYGLGPEEPAPAVLPLNTPVAAEATWEFANLWCGFRPHCQRIQYDAIDSSMFRIQVARLESCPACGSGGLLGLGDLDPVAARFRVQGDLRLPSPLSESPASRGAATTEACLADAD